jgi:hypothetical protein
MAYHPSLQGPRNIREIWHTLYGELVRVGGDSSDQEQNLLDHENAYNPHQTVKWVNGGQWVPGTYQQFDQVRENGWTMIANKVTSDYPSPQQVGSPFWTYEGAAPTTDDNANQIISGQRYTNTTIGFQIERYRLYTFVDQQYDAFLVVDPLGIPIVTPLVSFTAPTTGWIEFSVSPIIIPPGTTFDLSVATIEPDPAPTPIQATYNYLTPQNPVIPTAGQIQHSRGQSDLMSISYTDDAAGDRTALIQNLALGDQIQTGGVTWTVQSNSDQTTYANITVTPAVNGAAGVQTVTFLTNVPQLTEYMQDTDYWLTSPLAGTINGIIGVDADYDTITINDSAYGTDVYIVQVELSPDWDVITPAESAAGGQTQLSRSEVSWVQINTERINFEEVMTTDNTWTTMGIITLPVDTGFRARSIVTAKRTDGFGFYHAEYFATMVNDAGAVSSDVSVIHESATNPVLDTRVNVSGSDAEFQVRGMEVEDWHWMTVIFNREIV